MGYLERADISSFCIFPCLAPINHLLFPVQEQVSIPILLAYLPASDINPSVFMRALIISLVNGIGIILLPDALMAMAEVPPTPSPI